MAQEAGALVKKWWIMRWPQSTVDRCIWVHSGNTTKFMQQYSQLVGSQSKRRSATQWEWQCGNRSPSQSTKVRINCCLTPAIHENPISIETEKKNQLSVFQNLRNPPQKVSYPIPKIVPSRGVNPVSLSMGRGVTVHSTTRHVTTPTISLHRIYASR